MMPVMLRPKQVMALTGMSRRKFYELLARRNEFPGLFVQPPGYRQFRVVTSRLKQLFPIQERS